jgi:outer membrane protein TolC
MLFIASGLVIKLSGQGGVLENYVREGLESNQALKQKQLDYSQRLFALKEAKGMFFPDLSMNARYTVADGGRIIEFPIGDLLNPVYNTLNLLTASNQFPSVENQEFNFYRPREQETKLSLRQPIYSSDIIGNLRIKREYTEISRVDVDVYRRALVKEIKTAYYTYMKAFYLDRLVDSTFGLVKENLRVSNRLYNNNVVTIDAVYRSEAEVSRVEVEKARARNMLEASKSYFNFLLNRSLGEEIEVEATDELLLPESTLEQAREEALAGREELGLIDRYIQLNQHVMRLQKGTYTPDLFGAVDYGFQGEEYRFTGEDDFVLASVVLQWSIFQGMTNRNKIRQTRIEGEKLEASRAEAASRIQMQVINDYYALLTGLEAVRSAEKQLQSSRKAFTLIERKYAEGQSTLLEFIDARTSFTTAQSNLIIARNDYFIKKAALEYSSAGLDMTKY